MAQRTMPPDEIIGTGLLQERILQTQPSESILPWPEKWEASAFLLGIFDLLFHDVHVDPCNDTAESKDDQCGNHGRKAIQKQTESSNR